MKIESIEYENFRNFRDYGTIKCSTDGKVTIIYGKNGDGKTTLHQLFQWVLYGRVKFNKTTTDHLYNLAFEREQNYGDTFEVMGRIDFEHDGSKYSITRKYIYKKGVNDSEKIGEELSLQKMDEDYNWKRVERPVETIEKLLPSGLSEYFFFDGESMIADLRVKGKDSASKLRKALYSMFDLDVVESALDHIGRTDLKTTVLGKLYLSQADIKNGNGLSAIKTNIENAQNKITEYDSHIQEAKDERKKKQEMIAQISEQIGSSKSKAEYEAQRSEQKQFQKQFLENVSSCQAQFGDAIMEMFPSLLISKAVNDAKGKLNLKINTTNLPSGLNKKLISYLLKASTTQCICGHDLGESEREHIQAYLSLLPPKSPAILYHDFTHTAERLGKAYDKEKIERLIVETLNNQENAKQCDQKIKALDEIEKKSPDIEDLVVDRRQAEERVNELDQLIVGFETEKSKQRIYLKRQMRNFDELTEKTEDNKRIAIKMDIMKEVEQYFTDKLERASTEYSKKLEENIQYLLNEMLTSKRTVSVSKEFAVRVTDSYNDESKSEGQFAVVSFAYIGGVLKMLKDDQDLQAKEYPLVLDGPFSKLDPDQRQNVVNMLPQFAPQVIVFSKDDLHDVIAPENIGRVWTIQSNEEKNVARIEEGKLWK